MKEEVFIKKYWAEENVLFYMHFHNGKAIRQLEISDYGKVYLTNDNPQHGESFLYDQSLEELDIEEHDYISDGMFNEVWNDR